MGVLDALGADGDGALGELLKRGIAKRTGHNQLDEHGQIGASDDLHVLDVAGDDHGLVERRTAPQVHKDQDAIALSGHVGDRLAQVVTERNGLGTLKGNNREVGLVAGDHVDSALETIRELTMTSKDKTDH